MDNSEFLPEYPMFDIGIDSTEEVDFGYHSIGKNIEVNQHWNLYEFVIMYW